MLLAQISDLHVTAAGTRLMDRVDTAGYLARAIAHVNALSPAADFVIITGDLVDQGSPAEYENLRAILAGLAPPWGLLPGNHDDRTALRQAFAGAGRLPRAGEFLHYVVEELPVRLIALDTQVPGETGGALCPARLDWLAARLDEAPARPTVIAMHHPPFVSGIVGMDAINCANSDALGSLVARHPQVERIICGHIHRPICLRWHGTVVTSAPSTAHQVALDLEPHSPVAWIMEPPACHLHYWQPEMGLVTHLSYIGDYGPATAY
jgi:3',5'-cyclic AMP phosphodiesterase CpdA